MISKSEPLSQFVGRFEESGLSLGVFPTQRGDRYAIRSCDPDDPATGLGFVASFASSIEEANRPTTPAARVKASKALDALLHDPRAAASFSVCYCVIDADSLSQFPDRYGPEDLGKTFSIVAKGGTAQSDSYLEVSQERRRGRSVKD